MSRNAVLYIHNFSFREKVNQSIIFITWVSFDCFSLQNVNTCPVDRQVYNLVLARHGVDDVVHRRVKYTHTHIYLWEFLLVLIDSLDLIDIVALT